MKYKIETVIEKYIDSKIESQLITNIELESIENNLPSVQLQNDSQTVSIDMMPNGTIKIVHESIIKMDADGVIYIVPKESV